MSASKASLGYGATFATGVAGSPITYTVVAEIASINFAGFSVPEVDVTHLQSPGSMNESIPGLLKPGSIELSGNFISDTTQQALTTLGQARTIFPFKISTVLSDGSTFTITGSGFFAKIAKGPFSADKKIDFSATVQVAGAFSETTTP